MQLDNTSRFGFLSTVKRKITYCGVLFVQLLVTCFILCLQPAFATEQRPNILLITADDLGYDDLSLHNHDSIHTPNQDRLAKQSVQFSDFSVTPVCSTTRASLLTGRDFYKTGVSGVHGGRDFLNLSETLLSNIMKKSGYKIATWGKWHLGKTEGYMPHDRGFDQAYYAELYQHKNSYGFRRLILVPKDTPLLPQYLALPN
ncbi:sulfatase-like hydrolase/transferase [Psychrosphaera sp. B3R10]|uniref:sulfatase-like hydrolase/transferase n=1 Tax=unclassified Psychrosphaera TaxID=2641570 RepID=UPI001C096AB2|nr:MULTISPECIES: sulfatase-like hydrolase/transferase [unclassified Psychrosphaera]MBU2880545.1 sulfatase-like hydrolase/transferase [Psychrosphaera sp. I2R16]MBU2989134.1 sulfatase-like hydrolase/transferase [Psychrosphaera sp. B3R10]MDO6717791.1 sulfatase-like hydrolase/transferase [Psychrosphaera sp. 1_MG-2023]